MTAAEQYNARFGRIEDAIQLKVPDRVPVLTNFRYFAAKYAGLTPASAFYDDEYDKFLDVKTYAKKLIDSVGQNGGFVMCTRGVPDETKPENVKAWIEYTKEYGAY